MTSVKTKKESRVYWQWFYFSDKSVRAVYAKRWGHEIIIKTAKAYSIDFAFSNAAASIPLKDKKDIPVQICKEIDCLENGLEPSTKLLKYRPFL